MVFCICSLEKIPLWGFFCGNIYVKTLNIFKSGKAHVDDPVPACGGPAPPHTPRSLLSSPDSQRNPRHVTPRVRAARTMMTTASRRGLISSSFMKDILHKLQTLE